MELGKSLYKLMIPTTHFEKFSSQTYIMSIKVIYMTTHSSKSYKWRNKHSIRVRHLKREYLLDKNQSRNVYHKLWRKPNC